MEKFFNLKLFAIIQISSQSTIFQRNIKVDEK